MKKKLLNVQGMREYVEAEEALFFIQLPNSKLYRVPLIPEKYCKTDELFQVLRTLCKKYHKGMFYFKLDEEARQQIGLTLFHMDIDHWFVTPSVSDVEVFVEAVNSTLNFN